LSREEEEEEEEEGYGQTIAGLRLYRRFALINVVGGCDGGHFVLQREFAQGS